MSKNLTKIAQNCTLQIATSKVSKEDALRIVLRLFKYHADLMDKDDIPRVLRDEGFDCDNDDDDQEVESDDEMDGFVENLLVGEWTPRMFAHLVRAISSKCDVFIPWAMSRDELSEKIFDEPGRQFTDEEWHQFWVTVGKDEEHSTIYDLIDAKVEQWAKEHRLA